MEIMSDDRIKEMQGELDSKTYQKLNLILDQDVKPENKSYDLNALLNFIYTNRIYQSSEYSNSLFLKKVGHVKDYTYYDNFLIAELEDKYMATPVVDVVAGMRLKLVCIDKEGRITVKDNIKW